MCLRINNDRMESVLGKTNNQSVLTSSAHSSYAYSSLNILTTWNTGQIYRKTIL